MSSRILFFFLTIITSYTSWSLDSVQFKRLNEELEQQVNIGNLNKALQLSNDLLKRKLNKNERYIVLTTKSKIHFWTENLYEYNRISKQAFEIKKQESMIYLAYYYSQKAAYFHYHMLGDSAVFYSDKSMELLKQNWNLRKNIPFHFIYQLYGTTFIYRVIENRDYSNSEVDCEKGLFPILKYLDSASIYINQVIHFNQEKAIIYRSKGNRIMDVVGYSIRNNRSDFKNYDFQINKSNEAIREYNLALNSLNKKDHTLSNGIKSLIALSFYCTNRKKQGDEILWPIIQRLEKNQIKVINSENIQLLNVLQTFTQNIISNKKIDSRIYSVMRIYESLREDWYLYLITKNKNHQDSYGQSPTSMLSLIKVWLNKLRIKDSDLTDDLSYGALDNYVYYSKTLSDIVKKNRASGTKNKKIKALILKFLNLQRIQHKLGENEALMVRIFASMGKESFLLITKQDIKVDSFKRMPQNHFLSLKIADLSDFKIAAYQNFLDSPFNTIFKKTKLKKIFVAIDIFENYDLMITDTIGNSFEKLHFLKRKINLVKIYNPIDFFSDENVPSIEIENKFKKYLISHNSKYKLPFSEEAIKNIENGKINYLEEFDSNEPGIVHIIGHGYLKLDNDFRSFTNSLQSNSLISKILKNSVLKTDLLVLNFCFGSHKRDMFYPDRDLQNQLISIGAKAVIASPYETVDQSSAWIFKKFYSYLNKGIKVEDALHQAKMDYLKTHKGALAHPIYWSTYELTTNVKNLHIKPINKEHSILFPALLTFSGVIVAFILLFVKPFTN